MKRGERIFSSTIVRLPDLPMVSVCDDEHLLLLTPAGDRTFRDVREEFILDIATLRGRTLREVARVVAKMRVNIKAHPSEFTAAADEFLERLYVEAVAQRLLGKIE